MHRPRQLAWQFNALPGLGLGMPASYSWHQSQTLLPHLFILSLSVNEPIKFIASILLLPK